MQFKTRKARSLFGQSEPTVLPQGRRQRSLPKWRPQLGTEPQNPWPQAELSPQGHAPEHNLGNPLKITESEIGDGLGGNIKTIDMMKKVARIRSGDPLLRKLALNILQEYGVKSHHFVDEALAIGDYVKNRVRYVRDPDNIEYLTDPLEMLKHVQDGTAQGDCDDMALFCATLLLAIGHQPLFRAVRYEQPLGNFNHIYVVDYDKNPYGQKMRVVLDCIMKDQPIGYEVQQLNGEEYPV